MAVLILDVYYKPTGGARVAGLGFSDIYSTAANRCWVREIDSVKEYVPGEFYRRELPCLLELIQGEMTPEDLEKINLIITDSYTHFSKDRPGLGYKLWEALGKKIPVIGIAKSKFKSAEIGTEVHRGITATKPLWVTAIGIDEKKAAGMVEGMAGEYRKPDLVWLVDKISREELIPYDRMKLPFLP